MTGRRILITGAGGFVGSHLAQGFAALGDRVCAVDREFDDAARARLAGCTLLACDLGADGATAALPAADVIVHGAALTTAPEALGMTAADHVAANMAPLLAMLRHAARVPPACFVFLSSSGVFGPADGSPDLADTDRATGAGPYAAAKRAGEALVPGALGGICATLVLRLGYLYGPHEAARASRARVSPIRSWLDAAAAGGTIEIAGTDPRRDWTFAPDLAPAIDRLLAAPGRAGPIHLCAPGAWRDSAVAGLILARHPRARLGRVPGGPVKPPMRPSAVAALEGFGWTGIEAGLDALSVGVPA